MRRSCSVKGERQINNSERRQDRRSSLTLRKRFVREGSTETKVRSEQSCKWKRLWSRSRHIWKWRRSIMSKLCCHCLIRESSSIRNCAISKRRITLIKTEYWNISSSMISSRRRRKGGYRLIGWWACRRIKTEYKVYRLNLRLNLKTTPLWLKES